MAKPVYKRVLLKISGEALAGDKHTGLDFEVIGQVCDVIKECLDMGVQVGLVVGGGNFWRGAKNSGGAMERTRADHMGMLATVMNCLAVADVCEQKGFPSGCRPPLRCGLWRSPTSIWTPRGLLQEGSRRQGCHPLRSSSEDVLPDGEKARSSRPSTTSPSM